ncbi:MAG: hypothetical protein ACI4WZ_00310 [Eubacteriales bacterium]
MKLFNKYAPQHTKKKTHSIAKRILPIMMSLALLLSVVTPPALAVGNPSEKEEVIYINLAADGSIKEVYAVNIFSGGDITDHGEYSAVEMLNTMDKITQKGDTITFSSSADRVYYKGKMISTVIPWNISMKYYIDGKEYSADEVAGKSGKLEIKFKVTKNASYNGSFFDDYALQAAFTLDTKNCSNITAADATLANVGSRKQITYTILPGKGIDTSLTADVKNFEMDAVSINGIPLSMSIDVDDEELMDQVTELLDAIAELDDGANELYDGISELKDGAAELKDGAVDLDSGAQELVDGAAELKDGAAELKDGAVDLDRGAQELVDGAAELKEGASDLSNGATTFYETIRDVFVTAVNRLKTAMSDLLDGIIEIKNAVVDFVAGALELKNGAEDLHNGTSQLNDGAIVLESGLSALSGSSDDIRSGAYQVFVSLTSSAETQLNKSLEDAGFDTVTLTPENYETVLDELLNTLSDYAYAQAEAAARSEIQPQVEAAVKEQIRKAITEDEAAMAQIDEYVETNYGDEIDTLARNYVALEVAKQYSPEDPEDWLNTTQGQIIVAEYLVSSDGQAAYAAARAQIKEQYVSAAVDAEVEAQMASDDVQAQIDAEVEAQMASEEVQAQISAGAQTGLNESDAYNNIISLKTQLNSYNDFYTGLNTYTYGVDSAAAGAAELKNGTAELVSGAEELKTGASKLYDGAVELQTGVNDLYDGASEINDGVSALADGIAEFESESLKLSDGAAELAGGAKSLCDGTVELKDGSAKLVDGANDLKDGANELYDGTIELKDGTAELLDGVNELKDGVNELYDGVTELKDGTAEMRSETDGMDDEISDKIDEMIESITGGSFEVVSFVSEKNTNVETVQFVIQTESVKIDEVETVAPPVKEELTFWQKILRLFGLY